MLDMTACVGAVKVGGNTQPPYNTRTSERHKDRQRQSEVAQRDLITNQRQNSSKSHNRLCRL